MTDTTTDPRADFAGLTAVVTGGASGIGAATARCSACAPTSPTTTPSPPPSTRS